MEKKIVGVDVGIRNIFSFDLFGGLQYKASSADKYLYMSKNFEVQRNLKFEYWLQVMIGKTENYIFGVEDCLLTGIKTKRKVRDKIYEKNVFDLIGYFLKTYHCQIIYVNSRDSSVECSKCGLISHYNRVNLKGYRYNTSFECINPECKLTCDSDINACKVMTKRAIKHLERVKNGENQK
jgi:hypothetical protein